MSTPPGQPFDAMHYSTFEPEAQKELYEYLRKAREERPIAGSSPIPIFVITCDRLTGLINALVSYYKNLADPITIVIHDNCSTFPPTLQFLERLAKEGIPVYKGRPATKDVTTLSSVREAIQHWYKTNRSSHYIVTDPDIEIEAGAEDMLQAHKFILSKFNHIDAVGPMLRRDDLPEHYPLRELVHKQQEKLYLPEMQWVMKWGSKALIVQSGWIDTAFALYRSSFKFHNLNRSLQTHEPYVARHSDWYIDPLRMAPDQVYYKQKNNPVGHWSSTWLPDDVLQYQTSAKDMTLKSSYRIVRKSSRKESTSQELT